MSSAPLAAPIADDADRLARAAQVDERTARAAILLGAGIVRNRYQRARIRFAAAELQIELVPQAEEASR